jgi:hypothetical protein
MVSSVLDGHGFISGVDTDLTESLLGVVVEFLTNLRLSSRFFINPESSVISKALVVHSSRKKSLFNNVNVDAF